MATAVFKAVRDTTLLPATFDYTTVADTAIAGRDFQAVSGTATIPVGVSSVNIEIPIVDKDKNSLSREFSVEFSNPSQGVRLQNTTAKCTITTQEDLTPLSWGSSAEKMFLPRYWTIDSQSTESCSIISSGDTFTAYMTNRTKSGLAGIIWSAKDKYDHAGIGYQDHTNMSTARLWFRLTLGPGVPDFSNETLTPTLTMTLLDGTIHYIPMYAYAENISTDFKSATIKLEFNNLKSGPNVDIPVDTTQVDNFFFSLISENYVESTDVVPVANSELTLTFALQQPDTGYTTMQLSNLSTAPHDIRMCTSYDDMYNLTPERVIDNTYKLGYRDMINHYNGMSHYYQFSWNGTKWELNRTVFLNKATEMWMSNFFTLAKSKGFKVINSLSFELMSTVCPPEWVQHDWNDALAATGYTPPSWVLSPNIEEGMQYLNSVIGRISSLCAAASQDIIIQIGEPWWWYNTATNLPCIYDYDTKVKFNTETGLFAQDIGTIYNYRTGTPYDEYVQFLSKCLGDRVVKFGTDLKVLYPSAKITLLPFLPSIIGNGLMEFVNFPEESYSPANFDFYCSECYDWLLKGEMEKSFTAITIPTQTLGFPENGIHYLAGFVPDETLAPIYGFDPESNYREYLWKMIMGNIALNELKYPEIYQYIWAYPQIMHDSISVHGSGSIVFHMGSIAMQGYLEDTPPIIT